MGTASTLFLLIPKMFSRFGYFFHFFPSIPKIFSRFGYFLHFFPSMPKIFPCFGYFLYFLLLHTKFHFFSWVYQLISSLYTQNLMPIAHTTTYWRAVLFFVSPHIKRHAKMNLISACLAFYVRQTFLTSADICRSMSGQ